MITIDTITDEQIFNLRMSSSIDDSEVEHHTFFALRSTDARLRARARAHCVALLNARSATVKEAK